MELRLHQALDFEVVFEARGDGRMEQLFGQSQRESRRFRQVGSHLLGFRHQLVVLDDMVDEAQCQCLLGVDKPRREDQLLGL
jgi:hypothetical protein